MARHPLTVVASAGEVGPNQKKGKRGGKASPPVAADNGAPAAAAAAVAPQPPLQPKDVEGAPFLADAVDEAQGQSTLVGVAWAPMRAWLGLAQASPYWAVHACLELPGQLESPM